MTEQEQMAIDINAALSSSKNHSPKDIANTLYSWGYRKLNENTVILSKKDAERFLSAKKLGDDDDKS